MKPFVTAVVVAPGDSEYLAVTLEALRNQHRRADRIIVVDTSTDRTINSELLQANESLIATGSVKNLGEALAACEPLSVSPADTTDWLWLLHDDSAPRVDALTELLKVVEVSPSVAVIGPKQLQWNDPRQIMQLGLTLTRRGAIFSPVAGELDQAQHDELDDVLAVGTAGMLVRTQVFTELGGFDPAAPNLAADVDFSIRVRRAGHRVVVAPLAQVAHAGLSLAGKRSKRWLGTSPRAALRRANMHLRIAYSPLIFALVYILFAPVIGILRAIWSIAAKHPNRIWAELSGGFWLFFTSFKRLSSRRLARKNSVLGLSALDGLRATRQQVRQQRLNDAMREDLEVLGEEAVAGSAAPLLQEGAIDTSRDERNRQTLSGSGAYWWVAALSALSFAFWPTNQAAIGGGLLPLSADWYTLFTHAGASFQNIGLGFYGPSDPFNWVLLALGSLTPWQPSLGVAVLLFLAKPLAFLGAWKALSLITSRGWLRNLGALLFALWPAFSTAQLDGRITSVIATITLPWFTLATARAAGMGQNAPRRSAQRTWSWVGASGLLLLVIGASAPNLLPVLLAAIVVVLFSRLRKFGYLLWIPLPLAAAMLPIIYFEVVGLLHPLAPLADPGLPQQSPVHQFWQLLLAGGTANSQSLWGAGAYSIWITVPVILLAAIALLSKRFVFASTLWLLVIAALVSAWLAERLEFAAIGVGSSAIAIDRVNGSPYALLALAAMGIITLAIFALDQLSVRAPRRIFAALTAAITVVPSAMFFAVGPTQVSFGGERVVPSIVAAETARGSQLKTLVLKDVTVQEGETQQRRLTAELVSGDGVQLDDVSSAYRFALAGLAKDRTEYAQVGQLVADLASANGTDSTAALRAAGIGYILQPSSSSQNARALAIALDGNDALEAVGQTDYGRLWRVTHPNVELSVAPKSTPSPWSTTKIVQLAVILGFILLAIPGRSVTSGRRRESEIFVGQTDEPTGGDDYV